MFHWCRGVTQELSVKGLTLCIGLNSTVGDNGPVIDYSSESVYVGGHHLNVDCLVFSGLVSSGCFQLARQL